MFSIYLQEEHLRLPEDVQDGAQRVRQFEVRVTRGEPWTLPRTTFRCGDAVRRASRDSHRFQVEDRPPPPLPPLPNIVSTAAAATTNGATRWPVSPTQPSIFAGVQSLRRGHAHQGGTIVWRWCCCNVQSPRSRRTAKRQRRRTAARSRPFSFC